MEKSKLRQWRHKNDLTVQALADLVGYSNATISRVEIGTAWPSLGLMINIYEVTKGEIRPNDFFPEEYLLPAHR